MISAKECQILQRKVSYQAADLLNVFQTCIASFKFNRAVILNMPFGNLILSCTNHWKIQNRKNMSRLNCKKQGNSVQKHRRKNAWVKANITEYLATCIILLSY